LENAIYSASPAKQRSDKDVPEHRKVPGLTYAADDVLVYVDGARGGLRAAGTAKSRYRRRGCLWTDDVRSKSDRNAGEGGMVGGM
jgi:hypothetical protein